MPRGRRGLVVRPKKSDPNIAMLMRGGGVFQPRDFHQKIEELKKKYNRGSFPENMDNLLIETAAKINKINGLAEPEGRTNQAILSGKLLNFMREMLEKKTAEADLQRANLFLLYYKLREVSARRCVAEGLPEGSLGDQEKCLNIRLLHLAQARELVFKKDSAMEPHAKGNLLREINEIFEKERKTKPSLTIENIKLCNSDIPDVGASSSGSNPRRLGF